MIERLSSIVEYEAKEFAKANGIDERKFIDVLEGWVDRERRDLGIIEPPSPQKIPSISDISRMRSYIEDARDSLEELENAVGEW
jgi:hypothetical protein